MSLSQVHLLEYCNDVNRHAWSQVAIVFKLRICNFWPVFFSYNAQISRLLQLWPLGCWFFRKCFFLIGLLASAICDQDGFLSENGKNIIEGFMNGVHNEAQVALLIIRKIDSQSKIQWSFVPLWLPCFQKQGKYSFPYACIFCCDPLIFSFFVQDSWLIVVMLWHWNQGIWSRKIIRKISSE